MNLNRAHPSEEHVSAVARFADDLGAVGIAEPHVVEAVVLYVEALVWPSREAWARLYRRVSHVLREWHGEPPATDVAKRLLAFLDDDFGREVVEVPVRVRLRETLLQHRIAS